MLAPPPKAAFPSLCLFSQKERPFQPGGQGSCGVATAPCWVDPELPHPTEQITYDIRVLAEERWQGTKSNLTVNFSEGHDNCGLDKDVS